MKAYYEQFWLDNLKKYPETMIQELPKINTAVCLGCGPSQNSRIPVADAYLVSYPHYRHPPLTLPPENRYYVCAEFEHKNFDACFYWDRPNAGAFIFDGFSDLREIKFEKIYWYFQKGYDLGKGIVPAEYQSTMLSTWGTGPISVELAVLMGAKRITLVGIDHTDKPYRCFEKCLAELLKNHPEIEFNRALP